MIDVDALADHPEELLLRHKRDHEERVANLLDIQATHKTKLVFLKVNIGGRTTVVSRDAARAAVLPKYPEVREFEIDLTNLAVRDDDPSFWRSMGDEIVRQVRADLRPSFVVPTPTSLSVFALAPIPLLMVLGRVLGDIATVNVFQKLRVPDTWSWQDAPAVPGDGFALDPPQDGDKRADVALVLSVSGFVHDEEVASTLEGVVPIWRVTASRTDDLNFVLTRKLLQNFAALFRQALHDIRRVHGQAARVHLFPAVPNSVAVECGKVLLPKADPAIKVYDRNRNGPGWVFALDLLTPEALR